MKSKIEFLIKPILAIDVNKFHLMRARALINSPRSLSLALLDYILTERDLPLFELQGAAE
jgi:hypothetical protein